MQSVTELPFNRHVGLRSGNDPAHVLILPAGEQFLNHLGTVHASALLALAEASSGEFLLRQFGQEMKVVPVVRRLEAKFRKPAHGEVHSVVGVAEGALAQMEADLAGRGRALLSVAVELHDEAGAHVLSASVEWFVQRVGGGNE